MKSENKSPLPPGWSITTISKIVNKLQYGYTAKASYDTDGPRFLRITDIKDDGVDWETVPRCKITEKDLEKYLLANGDIVFARSGSIEKAWRVEDVPPSAVFASYLIRGVPLDDSVGPWIKHFLKSNLYLKKIGAAGAGIGMKNVNAKKLGAVEIPIPPLSEQNRITHRIEALQAKSKKAKQALEAAKPLLDKLRQSTLASAFRGDLTAGWREKNPDVESASVLLERIRKERRKKWEENELAKMRLKGKEPKDNRVEKEINCTFPCQFGYRV
jgi:type I restriction enzyme, S subunit